MVTYFLSCSGEVTSQSGTPQCSGNWVLTQAPEQFDVSQLDPAMMAGAWSAGFVLIGTCFYAGRCFKILLSMIR